MNISLYGKHVKNFFCFLLKNIIFSFYLLSSTTFYIFYIIVVLIGVFSEEESNYLVSFCCYLLLFLIIGSAFLCVCLNIKTPYLFIQKIVGTPFLDKYYPITRFGFRGICPILVYIFTILLLLAVNNISLTLFQSVQEGKIESLNQSTTLLSYGSAFI